MKVACEGRWLANAAFDKHQVVSNANVVDNKRLGATFSAIRVQRAEQARTLLWQTTVFGEIADNNFTVCLRSFLRCQ